MPFRNDLSAALAREEHLKAQLREKDATIERMKAEKKREEQEEAERKKKEAETRKAWQEKQDREARLKNAKPLKDPFSGQGTVDERSLLRARFCALMIVLIGLIAIACTVLPNLGI